MALEQQILLLSILLLLGYSSSIFLHKYGIPNVVAFLLIGFFISNFLLAKSDMIQELDNWYDISESLALGLIGYKIGTELKIKLLKTERKLISVLLFAEAGGAFFLVFSLVYVFWGNFLLSITLGGLATATAPAATVEVLRKLKAKGPLTTKMHWILAFDDVLAVIVVEGVLVYVVINLGGTLSIGNFMYKLGQEIGLAIVIGVIVGFLLNIIVEMERSDPHDHKLISKVTFGILILMIGFANMIHTSLILTTMAIGATVTNLRGENYKKVGEYLSILMNPIMMIFFVLVGVNVSISDFSPFPVLALVYLVCRTVGKIAGTYLGAISIKTDTITKNNLGFGLLAQGGVALGLASLASNIFHQVNKAEIGDLIFATIVISTIFSEILGAFFTKFAVKRAGEIGKAENNILFYQEKIEYKTRKLNSIEF